MVHLNEHGQSVGDMVEGWSARAWPVAVVLEGRHVVLEPLSLDHAPALHRSLCDPGSHALWSYRPTEPPADVPATEAFVADVLAPDTVEAWAVVPRGGEAAGLTSFMRIDPATGQVEVAGVLYARHLQRTPATTEATHLLMRWAFDVLGYRRFEWKCDSLNEPSRRAAARLGFTYEGRFRHHMITKGRNRDTDWFSVTDSEWPAVRAAHERWLDPGNFDVDGHQRTPLRVET
ncbi:GNAT family protein [Nocardioides sp. 1609]|uniref:GNAT family N-acetyltransferase n=1 Tax=Nocardioides sp. 1609 TaxID=2508327 RepID=UPI00106F5F40|nr:GNAT family protein [Nocardioides sp. 1609]